MTSFIAAQAHPNHPLDSDMGLPGLHMSLPLVNVCFICLGFTYSDVISIK